MGRAKRFIARGEAESFVLVHRDQRDPLAADEDAPQHVFVRATPGNARGAAAASDDAPDDVRAIAEDSGSGSVALQPRADSQARYTRLAENAQYGIYFDDDYDYTQHLRPMGADPGATLIEAVPRSAEHVKNVIDLPEDVLPSMREEAVGLLLRALPPSGPPVGWDPDIVAALEDGEAPGGELEDDFFMMANSAAAPPERDEEELEGGAWQEAFARHRGAESDGDLSSSTGADDDSEDGSLSDGAPERDSGRERRSQPDDARSRFTEYSMTSSVMQRTEGLRLLDARFERLFAEYDDDADDAGDGGKEASRKPEVDGAGGSDFDSQRLAQAVREFMGSQATKERLGVADAAHVAVGAAFADDAPEEFVDVHLPPDKNELWDCESVLSLRSTLYNHPTVIRDDRPPREPRPPRAPPQQHQADAGINDAQESDVSERVDKGRARPPHETPEERRLRKGGVKEERRARREAKKATRSAFKAEAVRQDKSMHSTGPRGISLA